MELSIKEILLRFPLRIAITDFCNLKCFFCSNEGMGKCNKNKTNIDSNHLEKLLKILKKEGLTKIALTGGEPSIYPNIKELIDLIIKLDFKQTFFHTNGIFLDKVMVNIGHFTKIGISVHSLQFSKWRKITGGSKIQFNKLLSNLKDIKKQRDNSKKFPLVEIKHVVVKGINSDKKSLKDTLEFCVKNNFKFKFLNCEPINKNDLNHIESDEEIKRRLIDIGCKPIIQEKNFRGEKKYNPIHWFEYKGQKGVFIEIGCGKKIPCKYCYSTNEIFLTPALEIKPCHLSNAKYDLKDNIKNKQKKEILEKIYKSRLFLFNFPKMNKRRHWENEK